MHYHDKMMCLMGQTITSVSLNVIFKEKLKFVCIINKNTFFKLTNYLESFIFLKIDMENYLINCVIQ